MNQIMKFSQTLSQARTKANIASMAIKPSAYRQGNPDAKVHNLLTSNEMLGLRFQAIPRPVVSRGLGWDMHRVL